VLKCGCSGQADDAVGNLLVVPFVKVGVGFADLEFVAFWVGVNPGADFALEGHKAAVPFDHYGHELLLDLFVGCQQGFGEVQEFLSFQNRVNFL